MRLGSSNRPLIMPPFREAMSRVEVLDTSALLSWSVDALEGGFVVEGQRAEINRIASQEDPLSARTPSQSKATASIIVTKQWSSWRLIIRQVN